jgi:hypothetical protein
MAPQRQLVSVPENVEEGLRVMGEGHSDLLLLQRLALGLNYVPAITTMSHFFDAKLGIKPSKPVLS